MPADAMMAYALSSIAITLKRLVDIIERETTS